MRRVAIRWAVCASLLAAIASAAPGLLGGQEDGRSRREFMRQKLELSKGILEGLTVEDFALIAKNARALRRLSTEAQWEPSTIPNATEYIAFTTEFRKLADDLARGAGEKNLDGATLAYIRLTMNCVNCHKYVRGLSK